MKHTTTLIGKAGTDPRRYFVWILDRFFGGGGLSCYAVVDDFGNLVAVEARL